MRLFALCSLLNLLRRIVRRDTHPSSYYNAGIIISLDFVVLVLVRFLFTVVILFNFWSVLVFCVFCFLCVLFFCWLLREWLSFAFKTRLK